jgi:D-cysteine desulfhydrase
MADWLLRDRFPRLIQALRPVSRCQLPTPVHPLTRLGSEVGHPALWVKRDDLTSPLYGGNKPRKLDFLLGQAIAKGSRTLVTMGGVGSNHLLATALHGRDLGLRTVGVVFPQPDSEHVRANLRAGKIAGVELVHIPSKYLLPAAVAVTLARLRLREGNRPELIPGGGSSPLGSLGFVNAGLELAAQVQAGELPEPEAVFVPLGTGGTAAGLALGFTLAGLSTRVVAVRVIDRLLANRPRLLGRLRATAALCRSRDETPFPARLGGNLEIDHGYIGPGYGHPTSEGQRAVERFRDLEGLSLEQTYTGKAAAALLDRARSTQRPLLFWLTLSSADLTRPQGVR